ncbi:MAG TPA: nickel pincer cofactor biosynthesis protein LarB [Candidatus Saccharicenans sp.]|nr:nickel pincer cofactor biosynthesis protein LarB [Candidatus Saccharicenans sp.]HPP23402.1 nickel pincer cofactor biosynthesis protein LarB [Candidatus Saccharicenans sp.]HUM33990.1 nickel pincer cofactor biosynthesis protein LarB [Candidatus Saccharicenans sp.]
MKVLLTEILENLYQQKLTPEQALQKLNGFPYEDLDFAKVDHARELRRGTPEVVFGQGKTTRQILQISRSILKKGSNLLITRLSVEAYKDLKRQLPQGKYNELARSLTVIKKKPAAGRGPIAILTAGTSDIPVAEEAAVTCDFLGNDVIKIFDVGVAGLHRLLSHYDELQQARIIIAVAGLEGALPSVVAGLVKAPVIAVPTSVGYGASFHGLAALLAMLNSCPGGVAVVNIDNGFGAGYLASLINHLE